jgi:hypothetical protein
MSKYQYSELEQQINNVLAHQDKELSEIQPPSIGTVETRISGSEELLKKIGYAEQLEELQLRKSLSSIQSPTQVMIVPTWENLCLEAEKSVGSGNSLESLFTPDELKTNEIAVRQLNEEYNNLNRLDKYDIAISASAGILGAAVDILLVGIPQTTPEGLKGGTLANYIRDQFDKKFPKDEMDKLASDKRSKVPYDGQDNRHTVEYVEGLSAYYHRLLSLGHDPLLGLIFGVADILNGSMTTIDKTGKIVSQVIDEYADRKESDIFAAIAKQIIHFKSDITTSMGLPAPLMSLFNLLQFGDIGDENQTIAEIVQGMYYEGYDFIHFCTLSIPVMIVEVVIRIGYAVKRIKEGNSIKQSIPFSTNHAKHPKLGTMLFIGHSAATAINAGKVYFTKNPLSINYPQWLAFSKYSYQQLKWVIMTKPSAREAYLESNLNEELQDVFSSTNDMFDDISKDYIVIMDI